MPCQAQSSRCFLIDGRVEINSNIVVRAIRPQTITRKSVLFTGRDGDRNHRPLQTAKNERRWRRSSSLLDPSFIATALSSHRDTTNYLRWTSRKSLNATKRTHRQWSVSTVVHFGCLQWAMVSDLRSRPVKARFARDCLRPDRPHDDVGIDLNTAVDEKHSRTLRLDMA